MTSARFIATPRTGLLGLDTPRRAAFGRSGLIAAADKREGDGASPVGVWPMRRVYFRADRMDAPQTRLPLRALSQTDGWCDAPEDRGYNRLVRRPYPASHEALWREDGRYDILVVLGHNDAPPISALGSAIFLHVAAEDFRPTEGCIALALPDLRDVLHHARPGDALQIARDGSGRPRPE